MALRKMAEALDKGLRITADIRASRQFKDGRTKLDKSEYQKIAKRIREAVSNNKNWTPEVIAALGKPYWDSQGRAVQNPSQGKPYNMRSGKGTAIILSDEGERKAQKKAQYETRKNRKNPTPKSVMEWAERLDKEKKWPKGKSLKGFLAGEKALDTRMKTLMTAMKVMGLKMEDGHAMSLGNVAKKGHPLYAKGMHGSDSGSARVPEPKTLNNAKRHTGDMHFLDAKRGGVANSALDRFAQYLTGDRGTLAKPTKVDVARMMQGENPDKVIAQRDKNIQKFKMLAGQRPIKTSVDTDQSFNLSDTMKIGIDNMHQTALGMPIYKP